MICCFTIIECINHCLIITVWPVSLNCQTLMVTYTLTIYKWTMSSRGKDSFGPLPAQLTLLLLCCDLRVGPLFGWLANIMFTKSLARYTHLLIYNREPTKECRALLWVLTLLCHSWHLWTISWSFSLGIEIMPLLISTSMSRRGILFWGTYSLLVWWLSPVLE